jgi:hypothetical protein
MMAIPFFTSHRSNRGPPHLSSCLVAPIRSANAAERTKDFSKPLNLAAEIHEELPLWWGDALAAGIHEFDPAFGQTQRGGCRFRRSVAWIGSWASLLWGACDKESTQQKSHSKAHTAQQ